MTSSVLRPMSIGATAYSAKMSTNWARCRECAALFSRRFSAARDHSSQGSIDHGCSQRHFENLSAQPPELGEHDRGFLSGKHLAGVCIHVDDGGRAGRRRVWAKGHMPIRDRCNSCESY